MLNSRSSGILLHPTSLPGQFGIGDLGSGAYEFVDFLADSLQQVWQVLPLGPTGYGNSPYLSYSALAGNPLLISPEKLQTDGWLNPQDWQDLPEFPGDRVDYETVIQTKLPLLQKASERFKAGATDEQSREFEQFCQRHAHWLEDYALFMALKTERDWKAWYQWEPKLAKRDPGAIAAMEEKLAELIYFQKFLQFQFFSQWQQLKQYANSKGIQIFGDIPIYVAHDSVDVWSHPEIFHLDEETGEAALMAGVPPDYFSATGQLWGNPVYNWKKLHQTNFKWWLKRVQGILEYVDVVRIDHFRGFEAFWAVEQGETTATNGKWLQALGAEFFQLLRDDLGKLPIVAEDLGDISPEVEALRDRFGFPGMKVLQFAFDSDRNNPFLPYNYVSDNWVVYTGTHDNDTTVGWYEQRSAEERARVVDYLGCICPEGIHWSLIRMAMNTVAKGAIFPLQDILGLGTEAKMNTPSQAEGNWSWRYQPHQLTPEIRERLTHLTHLYGRAPA